MWSSIGKAALAASFVALTPAASILSGGQAHSDVYVSGSVAVGFPSLVVGFSYGDPFAVGHVHYSPVHCAVGPLYYYPTYGVYTHYYPRYHYSYYPRRFNHHDVHVYHHGGSGHGYGHNGYRGHSPKYARGHYVHSDGKGWHGDRKRSGHGHQTWQGDRKGSSHKHNGKGHGGNGRHGNGRDRGGRGHGKHGTRGHND